MLCCRCCLTADGVVAADILRHGGRSLLNKKWKDILKDISVVVEVDKVHLLVQQGVPCKVP